MLLHKVVAQNDVVGQALENVNFLDHGLVFDEDFEITGPKTMIRSSGAFLGESHGAWIVWQLQCWWQGKVDMVTEGERGSNVV